MSVVSEQPPYSDTSKKTMSLLQSGILLQPGDLLQPDDSLNSGVLGLEMASIARSSPESTEAGLDDQLWNGVSAGDLDSVRKALDVGANIHMRSKNHYTPIMQAASLVNLEMLELLLEYGANVCDNLDAYNVLMIMCDSACEDEMLLVKCVQLLIDHGADLTATDWMGATPLLHAVRQDREHLILRLITVGGDCSVNTPDSEGWTPLFHAVSNGSLKTVELLIDCGAKVNLIDYSGRTLRDVAITGNNQDIIKKVTTDLKPELAQSDNTRKKIVWTRSSQYRKMLDEGPKLNDMCGYHDEAIQFLRGTGLAYVASVMSTKNLQLYSLLTWNETDWTKAGIHLSYHKRKILSCVQKYHEKEWSSSAFPDLSEVIEEGQVDLFKVVLALASFIRMTHITIASSQYLLDNYTEEDPTMTEDISDKFKKVYLATSFIEKQIKSLVKILQEIEKQDNCLPPDFIGKSLKIEKVSKFRVPLVIGCITCAVAVSFLLRKNVTLNLERLFWK